ncbi:MAG: hypothetical protein QXS93_03270 [Candidatus Micrarchaeia archaeon]
MVKVGKRNVFEGIPIIGNIFRAGRRKVSVYTDLSEGSISNKMFYGDMEIFRVKEPDTQHIRMLVHALKGKGDMEVFLSSEYADICKAASKNPEQTIAELKKIAEETEESKEVVRKILRKLSHSQDEVIRTYAFNEL